MHFNFHLFFLSGITAGTLQSKALARIIRIGRNGKGRQRKQIDPISILQNVKIPISCTDTDHIRNTASLSGRSSHPQHVMISPLNIHTVVFHKLFHNNMRTRTSVINIPDNMQMIHDQPLDQLTERNDKFLRTAHPDNRIYNFIIIGFFIRKLRFLRNQLFNDISKIFGQCLPDFGTGIFACRPLTHLDQTIQRNLIPVLHVALFFFDPVHLLSRIINKSSKGLLIPATHSITKNIVNFSTNGT